MEKALEAFKAVVRVEAIVEQVQKSVQAFEQRIELKCESHERRTDDRFAHAERRLNDKLEAHEQRLRELERRMAEAEGKISSALATAYRIAVEDEISRKNEKDAKLAVLSAIPTGNSGTKKDSTDA
ncbi:hypothetical protein [Sorangium sp. So ce1151]|uniref:hypothetical protein n=1 Tax=Sorangium sp. So ce1151 TaxID=3133332 RepID=UPI003F5D84BF